MASHSEHPEQLHGHDLAGPLLSGLVQRLGDGRSDALSDAGHDRHPCGGVGGVLVHGQSSWSCCRSRSGCVPASGRFAGNDELHDLGCAVGDLQTQHVPQPLLEGLVRAATARPRAASPPPRGGKATPWNEDSGLSTASRCETYSHVSATVCSAAPTHCSPISAREKSNPFMTWVNPAPPGPIRCSRGTRTSSQRIRPRLTALVPLMTQPSSVRRAVILGLPASEPALKSPRAISSTISTNPPWARTDRSARCSRRS